MPLNEGECPLRKFELVPCAGAYNKDPLEACCNCNFGDIEKGPDINNMCQCPSDMSLGEYKKLMEEYLQTAGVAKKEEFWEFVRQKRQV